MSRLTAGWVTCMVAAAEVTLPVVMTARNASTCLGLSIGGPCLMARHRYNISVFHMRIIRFDLIQSDWEHSVRGQTGSLPAMRTVFLILTAIAALTSGDDALAQTKTLYVAAYGGSFEQTMRRDIIPPFEKKHGVKIEYVAGNSTDTLAKLQAQKGNQQIDVAIVDDGPMYQAVQLGFCRELAKAPVYDDVYDVMKFASNKAVGIGMVGTGIMYAKKVFAENKWPAPTSWEDLKDKKFAKKLVIPPLNNSYGLHTLVMMARLCAGAGAEIKQAGLKHEERGGLPEGEELKKLSAVDWHTINDHREEWKKRWTREIERCHRRMPFLALQGLAKRFGDAAAVDDLSL